MQDTNLCVNLSFAYKCFSKQYPCVHYQVSVKTTAELSKSEFMDFSGLGIMI